MRQIFKILRMESTSLTNRIQISRSTYERVFDLGYDFEEREVDVKGKGQVKAYLLNEQHHKQVEVDQCIIDNDNQIVTNLRESISFLENWEISFKLKMSFNQVDFNVCEYQKSCCKKVASSLMGINCQSKK